MRDKVWVWEKERVVHGESIRVPIIKIRRSHDRLIFIMEIHIPGKTVFILRQGPYRVWRERGRRKERWEEGRDKSVYYIIIIVSVIVCALSWNSLVFACYTCTSRGRSAVLDVKANLPCWFLKLDIHIGNKFYITHVLVKMCNLLKTLDYSPFPFSQIFMTCLVVCCIFMN